MSAPVGVLGSGLVSVGIYAWLVLAGVILLGSKLLWWATERLGANFLKAKCTSTSVPRPLLAMATEEPSCCSAAARVLHFAQACVRHKYPIIWIHG